MNARPWYREPRLAAEELVALLVLLGFALPLFVAIGWAVRGSYGGVP